ncbi:hypothetical protein ACOZ4I_03870 [Haloarcula salina]|uniref:hypothetical protein n=1 Tax=Haloarcula salina TaxID=1429914 RepID=UPI003C6F514B
MSELGFPLSGSTLLTGPSNVGKTRLTAAALDAWLDREGTDGVVVLDFAPEFERDGTVLGGHLDRFTEIPNEVWVGRMDARAPRAESDTPEQAQALARENWRRARTLLDAVPGAPRAVFVNDVTIPFQHGRESPDDLLDYCDTAACCVCNAFDSDELGVDNPVSRAERDALVRVRAWADRTVELS